MSALDQYRELVRELLRLREEEERLLEGMDEAWLAMSQEEKDAWDRGDTRNSSKPQIPT